jgi:predicted PurR-regulated permease PerM
LAFGLAGAILTTILLRCLQSLTSVLNGLNLGVLLSLIYILLIIIAAGYILIENGANKLQKIEET